MGYPASAALLLKALTEEDNRWLHQDAINIVSKFSLFVIILADPVKDPLFYKQLQTNFPFYDRLTGSKFLFFSIIKQKDAEGFDGAHKRYKIFTDSEAYKQNHAAEETEYSELAIHAICTVLGVNYDETPCLIISNNLRFGQFCKITTSINELENQLIGLRTVADFVSTQSKVPSLIQLLQSFNAQVPIFDNIESLEISSDTISAVSKILQVVSSEGNFNEITYRTLMRDFMSSDPSLTIPLEYERKQIALGLLGRLNKKTTFYSRNNILPSSLNEHNSISFQIEFPLDNIDELYSTKKILKEWNNVQPSTKNYLISASFIEDNMMDMFELQEDYSLYAIPLCKSFETEITYSAVQLIRKRLGVDMPQYFSKYCPSFNNLPITPLSSLVKSPREIFFNNRRHDGKWIPPGLGESRLGFATMNATLNDFTKDWLPTEEIIILLEQWEIIQKIRNKSAHMEQVTIQDKTRLEEGLNDLHNANLLNALTSLKETLNH